MKPLSECLDLIQGKTNEDYARENPHAVLIGLGQIAGEMQRNPKQAAGTMFLNLSGAPEGGGSGALVNMVFGVVKTSRDVPDDAIYIGSGAENDLPIQDSSLSKSHARMLDNGAGWSLMDLGSTNGTYVNGMKVEVGVPQPLKGGDIVTLGRMSFTYYDAVSFAKLLFVQAMARNRTRSTPKTPGAARASATPGRSTQPPTPANPGGARTTHPNMSAAPAPWSQGLDGDLAARATDPKASPVPQPPEWKQRAVGKLPVADNGIPPATNPGSHPGFQSSGTVPPPSMTTTQPMTPVTRPPQEVVTPAVVPPATPEPTSFFRRMMLKVAQFFQRLAGG